MFLTGSQTDDLQIQKYVHKAIIYIKQQQHSSEVSLLLCQLTICYAANFYQTRNVDIISGYQTKMMK